jgi:Ser/Thr protein kinase RdoA (MazF antagonist)
MPGLPVDHERFARAALPAYGHDLGAPLRLLSLSENATYLLCDDDPLVLRVHRPGYHSLRAIASELDWMAALRSETPVKTTELVPAAGGERVVEARVGDRMLYVDAVTFVPGCTAEEAPDAVGFAALGELTALMHTHVEGWTVPAGFTRFRWDLDAILGPDARWGDWQAAVQSDADREIIARAASDIALRLTEFGTTPDRFGLIHADLRLANLMVDPAAPQHGITVIDFDDCGFSWHLADLGAVVSWIEDTPAAEQIIAGWLTGYLAVRTLPAEHLGMIPAFVMLRRIQLTAWTASHADADAAIAVGPGFARGTAQLAERYLNDRNWLQKAIFGTSLTR